MDWTSQDGNDMGAPIGPVAMAAFYRGALAWNQSGDDIKVLVSEFADLLKSIIETVDRFGFEIPFPCVSIKSRWNGFSGTYLGKITKLKQSRSGKTL